MHAVPCMPCCARSPRVDAAFSWATSCLCDVWSVCPPGARARSPSACCARSLPGAILDACHVRHLCAGRGQGAGGRGRVGVCAKGRSWLVGLQALLRPYACMHACMYAGARHFRLILPGVLPPGNSPGWVRSLASHASACKCKCMRACVASCVGRAEGLSRARQWTPRPPRACVSGPPCARAPLVAWAISDVRCKRRAACDPPPPHTHTHTPGACVRACVRAGHEKELGDVSTLADPSVVDLLLSLRGH
jgi:hypothetical protein